MISPWESSADAFLFAWKGLLNNSVTLKVPLKPPPSRLITNNQKSPLRYIRPDTDTPPPFPIIIYFTFWKNTHPPITHSPMFLSDWTKLSSLNTKNKSQVVIFIFNELLYKEKRKRKLCAFVRFYASVQAGSIFSSTWIPDPWVISGIWFSTPSKSMSSIVCYSRSRNTATKSNSFWRRGSILCGPTFLIDCVLCLLLLLADSFDLQLGLWFWLDLLLPK